MYGQNLFFETSLFSYLIIITIFGKPRASHSLKIWSAVRQPLAYACNWSAMSSRKKHYSASSDRTAKWKTLFFRKKTGRYGSGSKTRGVQQQRGIVCTASAWIIPCWWLIMMFAM